MTQTSKAERSPSLRPDAPGKSADRGSQADQAYVQLKQLILDGTLPAGAQMLELEAAGELSLVENLEEEAVPEIVEICLRLQEAGLLPEDGGIGMDPEGVAAIVDALIEARFSIEDIRAISQGYKLNAAIKGTPGKLKNGTFRHCGQRIMTWCVGNAKTEARGNAVIVTKAQSGSAKIDPLMALFDSVMLMSWNPVASGRAGMNDYFAALEAAS